ncbi:hypothetical protein EVAR_4977_1 [Eumeta japonica]|uniref:Uncharacterized protein n=1 Tax=Eumeta variegata TaxID=151549 RepID=A0A4C1UZT7_EUMVA|nr:hypothetical protein EVAR_4977_1 [Eumeta japonica]
METCDCRLQSPTVQEFSVECAEESYRYGVSAPAARALRPAAARERCPPTGSSFFTPDRELYPPVLDAVTILVTADFVLGQLVLGQRRRSERRAGDDKISRLKFFIAVSARKIIDSLKNANSFSARAAGARAPE